MGGTPATVALTAAGIPFVEHEYDHDPGNTSFGLEAASVLGLAYGSGEPALARNRAEVLEIVRAQQRENPKMKHSEQEIAQQMQNVMVNSTAMGLAVSNFWMVLLFGLVLGLPGGIFFRE